MAPIEFRGVSFARPAAPPIIRDLSLAIGEGEVLTLVGRSGAGKTTLLKLTNGLVAATAGTVLVEGRAVPEWESTRLRRRFGYVLQEVGLFPHLSVADNIGLVPRLEGWPPERVESRVSDLLSLVGLPAERFAGRWPDELSGGQRQRIGVARALAIDPPMLLMDEPFGALDPLTRAELHVELKRIQARLRKTIVLVTHDMGEAFALGDRIGVIDDGRLVACGPPADIAASTDAGIVRLLESVPAVPGRSA